MISVPEYGYTLEQCDVTDKAAVGSYRAKRLGWLRLLCDDELAIWDQITSMVWYDTVFRLVNELRRMAIETPSPAVGFNGPVARLLDVGFVSLQSTTIRRLTDKRADDKNRGVVSLRTLIAEMKDCDHLLTREAYVCHDGLPYDHAAARSAFFRDRGAPAGLEAVAVDTEGPGAWMTSERAHETFDRLSGVTEQTRSRNDRILPTWYEVLESRLGECDKVRLSTTKFIAHAADAVSRGDMKLGDTAFNLNEFARCQKAIYQVTAFVYGQLLWAGDVEPMPIVPFDHLSKLDKGWLASDECAKGHVAWKALAGAVKAWSSENWPFGEVGK